MDEELIEPEAKELETMCPMDTRLLYSIAISLKKLREDQKFINTEIYEDMMRKLYNR